MKKALAVLLAALFCLSAVACSGNAVSSTADTSSAAETTTSSDTASVEEDPFAEKQTISIAVWNIGNMITDEEDALRDYIYEKFNIEIKAEPVTWGDYSEKIKLWSSTRNLPDVTAYEAGFTETFDKWSEEGVVRALPESATDADKYPNLAEVMAMDYSTRVNKISDENSTYYAIPRPQMSDMRESTCNNGIVLRKDWLEEAGINEVPSDIDSLIDALKKMQASHPGTVGLTGYSFGWFTFLMGGECTASVSGWEWVYSDEDPEKIVPVWMTQNFVDGMEQMRKVYQAGVIDPDYLLLKGEEGRDKFINDKACAYAHSGPYMGGMSTLKTKMCAGDGATHPETTIDELIVAMPLLADSEGNITYRMGDSCWSESYLSCNVDDAKAERILALFDWLLDEETPIFLMYGFEDVDYHYDGDTFVQDLETDAEGNTITIGKKYPISAMGVLGYWSGWINQALNPSVQEDLFNLQNDYYDLMDEMGAVALDLPDDKGITLPEEISVLDTLSFDETMNSFMTYEGDLQSYWESWVEQQLANGYDQVVEEKNKLYQEKLAG